ncbi:hypothetical protein HN587_07975 [Candidatus Woesearchaeota archaeon]|jgi:hypothetical protein|nr:hypothetical protein [Candidatus Woesearchaeota archaeon]
MIESLFGRKKKKQGLKVKSRSVVKPIKEKVNSDVSARRFNEMIDYYSHELKVRLDELNSLREQNEIILKTALKQSSKNDHRELQLQKYQEENRILLEKIKDLEKLQ